MNDHGATLAEDAVHPNRARLRPEFMRDSGADAGSSPVNDAPTDPASAPSPKVAGSQRSEDRAAQEPKHRHRTLVWALVVLASVVLVVSMIANWVQTEVLDTDQFANSTDEILEDKDVQEQLSIFAVDQLYANVDVQAQIEQKLPRPAQPLAAPVTAATRQLATNVAETALASPRVQDLVATAINGAQQQFVSLIEDKGQYVSTAGRRRHPRVRELRRRPRHPPRGRSRDDLPDPGLVQQSSTDLKQRLTTAQSQIESARATLSQAQAGTLSPEAQQNLQTLETDAAELQTTVASLEQKIAGIQPKAPAQLQGRLSDLQGRLSKLDSRLTTRAGSGRRGAQGSEPGERHQARPHARLASDARHRPARPPGRSAPRRARRDEVQPAERAPGPRQRAPQPRLRAAGAGAPAVPGAPSTWRRGGAGRR